MQIGQREYQGLLDKIDQLTQRVIQLEEENIKLKDQLGLNSTNSSLPSSKDLYKIKKKERTPSGNKPGGQPGHSGAYRQRCEAHEVIKVGLTHKICSCGGEIRVDNQPLLFKRLNCPRLSLW